MHLPAPMMPLSRWSTLPLSACTRTSDIRDDPSFGPRFDVRQDGAALRLDKRIVDVRQTVGLELRGGRRSDLPACRIRNRSGVRPSRLALPRHRLAASALTACRRPGRGSPSRQGRIVGAQRPSQDERGAQQRDRADGRRAAIVEPRSGSRTCTSTSTPHTWSPRPHETLRRSPLC